MTVFLQVMTLFILMLCGLSAAKFKLLDDKGLRGLNALVLSFAQPALILHRLQTPASPELIGELLWVFALACGTIAIAGVISFRLFARDEQHRRAVLTSLSMLSNCGFMGFPIIIATLGWTSGTFLGAALGQILPETLSAAMGIMLYGMFLAVFIPPARKERCILVAVILAALCSILFEFVLTFVSGGFAVIISALMSAAVCALLFPVKEEEEVEAE